MDELKSCPFCGEEPSRHPDDPGLVACGDPECAQSTYYVTVKAWNTRAATPEGEALQQIDDAYFAHATGAANVLGMMRLQDAALVGLGMGVIYDHETGTVRQRRLGPEAPPVPWFSRPLAPTPEGEALAVIADLISGPPTVLPSVKLKEILEARGIQLPAAKEGNE